MSIIRRASWSWASWSAARWAAASSGGSWIAGSGPSPGWCWWCCSSASRSASGTSFEFQTRPRAKPGASRI